MRRRGRMESNFQFLWCTSVVDTTPSELPLKVELAILPERGIESVEIAI
jgi:hypothetical protein